MIAVFDLLAQPQQFDAKDPYRVEYCFVDECFVF
jgi:hypothetical protein